MEPKRLTEAELDEVLEPLSADAEERVRAHIADLSVPTPEDVAQWHEKVVDVITTGEHAPGCEARGGDCRCHLMDAMTAAHALRDGAARAQALEAQVQRMERERAVDVEMLHGRGQQIDELKARAEAAERELAETRKRLETGRAALRLCVEYAARVPVGALEPFRTRAHAAALNALASTAPSPAEANATPPAPPPRRSPTRTEAEPHPLSRHVMTAEGPLRCTVPGCACGPGCVHQRFVDRARDGSAPAPLVEAVRLLGGGDIFLEEHGRYCFCPRLGKPGFHSTCCDDVDRALRGLAAHGAALAGSAPPALVEAMGPVIAGIAKFSKAIAHPGDAGQLTVVLTRGEARALLATHDAAKGGEKCPAPEHAPDCMVSHSPSVSCCEANALDAAKARKWDAAVALAASPLGLAQTMRRAMGAPYPSAMNSWDEMHPEARGQWQRGMSAVLRALCLDANSPSPTSEPSITHAALAAVVEAYIAEDVPAAEVDDLSPREAHARGEVVAVREVLRRVTGGQVPEVLPKQRVVEVLGRLARENEAKADAANGKGRTAHAEHESMAGVLRHAAHLIGLTLDMPPSGPGGGVRRHGHTDGGGHDRGAAAEDAGRTPGANEAHGEGQDVSGVRPEGSGNADAGGPMDGGATLPVVRVGDFEMNGTGGGERCATCEDSECSVHPTSDWGPRPDPTMATATHHGGEEGQPRDYAADGPTLIEQMAAGLVRPAKPREAPVQPTPAGPALKPGLLARQTADAQAEVRTWPQAWQERAGVQPEASALVFEGDGVRVLADGTWWFFGESIPEWLPALPGETNPVADVLARALAEAKRDGRKLALMSEERARKTEEDMRERAAQLAWTNDPDSRLPDAIRTLTLSGDKP